MGEDKLDLQTMATVSLDPVSGSVDIYLGIWGRFPSWLDRSLEALSLCVYVCLSVSDSTVNSISLVHNMKTSFFFVF